MLSKSSFWNRFLGNHNTRKDGNQHRTKSLQIEQLEQRQLLSVSPCSVQSVEDNVPSLISNDNTQIDFPAALTAADQVQKVYSTTPSITAKAGETITVPVMYKAMDGEGNLTGLGLRIHYDSSKLTYSAAENLLKTGRQGQVLDKADTANNDSDVTTDRVLVVAWADMDGEWPGNAEQLLMNLKFTVNADVSGTGMIRFTASSKASGYTFESEPVTVTVQGKESLATPTLNTPTVNDRTVSVSWNKVANATSYQLEYKLSTASTWTTETVSSSTTSATFTGKAGRTYSIRVKAIGNDSYSDSAYSSEKTITLDSPMDYTTIREQYPNFNLPESENDINIIFVDLTAGDDLSDLREAIAEAGTTVKPDLIAINTSFTANTLTYTANTDELLLDINATEYGSVTLVGIGSGTFTLDANQKCRAMTIGESTVVNLGGMTITHGDADESKSNSGYGGGIYTEGSLLTISNCTITENSTTTGGGIANYGTFTVMNSTIVENSAEYGGGLYNEGTLTLTNATIAGNSAETDGDGIRNEGTITANNTILVDTLCQSATAATSGSSNLSTFTNWASGTNNHVYDSGKPLFVNAANGNYHLSGDSQALDQGDNALAVDASGKTLVYDLAGKNRIENDTIDIGAYEFQTNQSFRPVIVVDGVESPEKITEWEIFNVELRNVTEQPTVQPLTFSWDASLFELNRMTPASKNGVSVTQGKTVTKDGITTLEVVLNVENPAVLEEDDLLVNLEFYPVQVESLKAGQSAEWTFRADDSALNVQVESIAYDLNDSGEVEINDLIAFARVFYQSSTQSETARVADFNGSGTVEINDLIFFARNYNKARPVRPTSAVPTLTSATKREEISVASPATVNDVAMTAYWDELK